MIRLTWLQFRMQAVTAAAALAAFAVLLAATGPHMARMYAASGISSCQGASCQNLATVFLQEFKADGGDWLYLISIAGILLAPALTGLFWGAPLIAHELETGTSALAWTQSITRTRWLAVKLTVGGLAAIALTEGMSLMQAWWAAPIGRAVGHGAHAGNDSLFAGQYSLLVFATHGITPLGYAAFAFTLGVTVGALIGRTVPAMAVTLAIFAVIQIAVPLWIRPHLLPARSTLIPVAALEGITLSQSVSNVNGVHSGSFVLGALNLPGQPGAWVLSSTTVNAAGRATSTAPAICFTPSVQNSDAGLVGCLASHGFRQEISYQPASRFWAFQSAETAIYLALTLALAGYCFRQLSRRQS